MNNFWSSLKHKIMHQLILPITKSVSPVQEVATGSAIGMFVGMTPTVGAQMYIVFIIWLFCRYVLRFRFDLFVGTALVWLSNPFTMFFIYYAFLKTGEYFLCLYQEVCKKITYDTFYTTLASITNNPENNTWDVIKQSSIYLLHDLGIPMIFGSLFYAIPFAILAYFSVLVLLKQSRIQKAKKMGLTYQQWREKYEVP